MTMTNEHDLLPLGRHNLLTAISAPWKHIRVPGQVFEAARTAFGAESLDDEQRVYRTLQATLQQLAVARKLEPHNGNDTEQRDPDSFAYLDARGDDRGQGLDSYWKWGFAAGWNDHKKHAPATRAARDVMAERQRQISVEGWTPEHDDEHANGGMAFAAAAYAAHSYAGGSMSESLWKWTGWASKWFKPKNTRSDLVRAGALIQAEIERLDRAEERASRHAAAAPWIA